MPRKNLLHKNEDHDPVFDALAIDANADIDLISAYQDSLLEVTERFMDVSFHLNITDIPSFEAICFLAAVESEVGFDDEMLANCIDILNVSQKDLWETIAVLRETYHIDGRNLKQFLHQFVIYFQSSIKLPKGLIDAN